MTENVSPVPIICPTYLINKVHRICEILKERKTGKFSSKLKVVGQVIYFHSSKENHEKGEFVVSPTLTHSRGRKGLGAGGRGVLSLNSDRAHDQGDTEGKSRMSLT